MVRIVCRRCQFRNDQYNLHCGNCGVSLAPESPRPRAVLVRNAWIGVLAGALLVVVAILVVQRGKSVPATEPSVAGSPAKQGAASTGEAAPVRSIDIPMPSTSSDSGTYTSDSADPDCAPAEVAFFLENTKLIEKEFMDGLDVARGTSRLLIPTVVSDLQAVRRSYASLGGPACTGRAQSAVEKAMTSSIDALLLFAVSSPDNVESMQRHSDQVGKARTDWADAKREVSNLRP